MVTFFSCFSVSSSISLFHLAVCILCRWIFFLFNFFRAGIFVFHCSTFFFFLFSFPIFSFLYFSSLLPSPLFFHSVLATLFVRRGCSLFFLIFFQDEFFFQFSDRKNFLSSFFTCGHLGLSLLYILRFSFQLSNLILLYFSSLLPSPPFFHSVLATLFVRRVWLFSFFSNFFPGWNFFFNFQIAKTFFLLSAPLLGITSMDVFSELAC